MRVKPPPPVYLFFLPEAGRKPELLLNGELVNIWKWSFFRPLVFAPEIRENHPEGSWLYPNDDTLPIFLPGLFYDYLFAR